MIVVSTLLCDRKRGSEMSALPAMLRLEPPEGVELRYYVNCETGDVGAWQASHAALEQSGRAYDCDYWQRASTWSKAPAYDQDQARLEPICVARNMARAYAVAMGASHLLFIDADVVVQPDGLRRLLAHDVRLIGGLVPGRGAHAAMRYVFGERWHRDNLIVCAHGTLGYCLIRRDLFEVIPFRWGPHPLHEHRNVMLSEDPCFGADAEVYYGAEWMIDTSVTAEHVGDLREHEAAHGGHL